LQLLHTYSWLESAEKFEALSRRHSVLTLFAAQRCITESGWVRFSPAVAVSGADSAKIK
jgi:hypothetical protein